MRKFNNKETHPTHLSQTILNRLFGRVFEREGTKRFCHSERSEESHSSEEFAMFCSAQHDSINRHAELVSASHLIVDRSRNKCGMTGEAVRNDGQGCHCEGGMTEAIYQPKAGSVLQSQLEKNPAFFEKVFSLLTFHFLGKCRAFTLAEGATHVDMPKGQLKSAFTLAEILITLGIIGVVAAITMPMLISNYKKMVTVEKLKQTYTILKNAELASINDNGEIKDWDFSADGSAYSDNFINKYYKPYLKSSKCEYEANYAWGSDSPSIKTASGAMAIVDVWPKNVTCLPNGVWVFAAQFGSNGRLVGKSIYIDINGIKSPNIFGIDVFEMKVINPNMTDGYYMWNCPYFLSFCGASEYGKNVNWKDDIDTLVENCYKKGGNQGSNSCGYLIQAAGWKIPDNYPIKF